MATEIELAIALITAVGGLTTVIGGLIVKFVKFKQEITGKTHEYDDEIVWLGEQLEQTDRWILEKQQDLNTVLSVVTNLSPDAKKLLQDQGINIIKATDEIQKIKEELDRIRQIRLSTIGSKTSIPISP